MSDQSGQTKFPIYLDEPAEIDLLSFDAVAGAVADALLDESLDPIALGLSGTWGSGKTSVLRLIANNLRPASGTKTSTLVVPTDPWRYDPQMGAKESLISEILTALGSEIDETTDTEGKAKKLLGRLVKRVDWGKAIQVAAKSSITMSVPDIDTLMALVKPKPDDEDPEPITDMVQFRAEFAKLLQSDGLKHLQNVVILVDDLDRCLPETVVETLETIRLFLSVPKMSFVIAADEVRIAEAIATRFPQNAETTPDGEEDPSKLYLHKIVQTSVPVPALSDFDTEAYLIMLQVQAQTDPTEFTSIVLQVSELRKVGKTLDDSPLVNIAKFAPARMIATRLKPIIHEKTKGNPRRIKRFLNDLSIRQNVADRRGITLNTAAIAKLMVLESYFPEEFRKVIGWLADNTLRENMTALEKSVGSTGATQSGAAATEAPQDSDAKPKSAKKGTQSSQAASPEATPQQKYGGSLIRWAQLTPSLSGEDLAAYLVFAASFGDDVFLSTKGLSEQIKDLATRFLSKSSSDNRSVTNEVISALPIDDARSLIQHIGSVITDQPGRQTQGVIALLRFARLRDDLVDTVCTTLRRIPPNELKAGAVLQLQKTDPQSIRKEVTQLVEANGTAELTGSLSTALELA
ncbi:hypothetical protein CH249_07005 [Rhodococcus sp. 05-2255-3B1]|uniref:KAP family P-loop NTPase fold protein n=1 Tax=unclassified Rhodococcus (in: high G+C Gram-positive bacteria) TaxID=192944 RepID=UPI000B9BE063|nr:MULTISPECIES: P-loop NTPase fold protein [unclassified Rhodococcus (in: high G+C Gram-positive bacteria)]OZE11015.1 hypothetical protein CH250_11060 [Rhodococcus sp. 05-2255-3C]OZE14172.1 hypothetical protein CH249_07005 [Rhodococcus sp. 05-2255-3B1]OZE24743.1 hypothetical protein CH255_00880 [Rhodococcus sp. 05-2255-2A2]